jgi:antitoxin component YwqK of YwqJK toxin-antitoxin module
MHFSKRYSLLLVLMLVLFVGSRCQDKTETTTTGNRITKEDTAFIGNDYRLTQTRDNGKGQVYEMWTNRQDTSRQIIKFYKDNKLISFGTYKSRQHEGIDIRCYPSGIVWIRSNFVKGQRHGRVKYYDEKGELNAIEEYRNGTLVSTKEVVKKQ